MRPGSRVFVLCNFVYHRRPLKLHHVFGHTRHLNHGAVGRKLDFLLQEMGREVNTTGSKVGDLEITRAVLDLKTELERIREQVQNVL